MKFIYLLLIIFLISCGPSGSNENPDTPDTTKTSKVQISQEAMNDVIESLPSPVEMAAAIQDLGVPFSKKYLMNPDAADKFDTNFKKSLGLGILSSDLGYLNIYSKTSQIIEFITQIKKIADDLKIGQFFDFQTLKRLATNNENLDSLMFMSVNSFHQMDEHLRNNNRSNLSALVVTGVWLEGIYLATQVHKEKQSKELSDRIGLQKETLGSLINILSVFKSDKNYGKLVDELSELQSAYEPITITITYGKRESKVVENRLVIVQNDKSTVEMTPEQLNKIIIITEKVRNKLIAL
jgi:hypothetical protein